MGDLNFKIYIITDYNIDLRKQLSFLKLLKDYPYRKCLAIQIRLKNKTKDIVRFINTLKDELKDIKLFVNNSLEILYETDIDGIHLKENTDLKTFEIKKLKNNGKLIIKSTHNENSVKEAVFYGLDGITYGPVFKTPSKLKYGPPNGYELIKNKNFDIPVFALGGINADNIREIKNYFHGIAAIRFFMNENIVKNIEDTRRLICK